MAEEKKAGGTLWNLLGEIRDHRSGLGGRFALRSVRALWLEAALAGRTSMAAAARWGRRLNAHTLKEFGIERKKSPCQSPFHYVFLGLDVAALEKALARWVRAAGSIPGCAYCVPTARV